MKKEDFLLIMDICRTCRLHLWQKRKNDFDRMIATIIRPVEDISHRDVVTTDEQNAGFHVFRVQLQDYNMFWYISDPIGLFESYHCWQMYSTKLHIDNIERVYQYSEGF